MITKSYLNDLSYKIIGTAITVHKELGPGLLESAYHHCMKHELFLNNFHFESQIKVPIFYKGIELDTEYRLDFIIDNAIIVELKTVEVIAPIHEAQLLTYMKLLKISKGILINFNSMNLSKEGSRQMVNGYFTDLPN